MKINPLIYLLLIESVVVLTGLLAYFIVRARKMTVLYQINMGELEEAKSSQEALEQQMTAMMTAQASQTLAAAQQAAPLREDPPVQPPRAEAIQSVGDDNSENLQEEVKRLQEQLQDKTAQLSDLQFKFDDLEKEYLILYRAQQTQNQG